MNIARRALSGSAVRRAKLGLEGLAQKVRFKEHDSKTYWVGIIFSFFEVAATTCS
jgi:hypothetical protein